MNDFRNMMDSIANAMGNSERRKSHGYWIPFAWAARALIEKGYGVTESVRQVLSHAGEDTSRRTIACVRTTYYSIKDNPWPAELGGSTEPSDEEPEAPSEENPSDEEPDSTDENFEV